MTAATAPIPGQGPNSAFMQMNELASNVAQALGGLHISSPHAKIFKDDPSSQQPEIDNLAKAKKDEESRNLLAKLYDWIATIIKKMIQGFKDAFGTNEKKDANRQGGADPRPTTPPGPNAADRLKAANDPRAEKPPANDGVFQQQASKQAAANEPAAAALAGAGLVAAGAGLAAHKAANNPPANGPGSIENGWIVEGEGKSRGGYKTDARDIVDTDLRELSNTPLKLKAPTYLLPGKASEADMVAHAIEALNHTMSKQLQDPSIVAQLKEASQMDDPAEAEKVFTKLLLGPAFGDAEKQSEVLRSSLAEQIFESLKQDEGIDESLAQVTAQAVVEGLPANMASQMLSPDQAERVTDMLEKRADDIERLASFNAMLGARPAIFDGTFDYLKERQMGDVSIFDQSHYKLTGKQDPNEMLDQLKDGGMMRPRG